ncbi:alpha-1,2-fucosyltransferase [Helicobacter sp. 23-1048]
MEQCLNLLQNSGEYSVAQEIKLMCYCQNSIIANSAFSWWAGYSIVIRAKMLLYQTLVL